MGKDFFVIFVKAFVLIVDQMDVLTDEQKELMEQGVAPDTETGVIVFHSEDR